MVRQRYPHNKVFNTPQDFEPVLHVLGPLGRHRRRPRRPAAAAFPTLPSNWIIDWRRFYELGASGGAAVTMTPSRKLDPYLVASLHNLPGGGGNLAFRNLKRGVNLGLPSGQDVAKHMKVKNPLTPDEIASDSNGSTDGAVAKQQGLHTATPLWYYILKEAKVRQMASGSDRSARPSSRKCSSASCTATTIPSCGRVKNWKPTLPSATPGTSPWPTCCASWTTSIRSATDILPDTPSRGGRVLRPPQLAARPAP